MVGQGSQPLSHGAAQSARGFLQPWEGAGLEPDGRGQSRCLPLLPPQRGCGAEWGHVCVGLGVGSGRRVMAEGSERLCPYCCRSLSPRTHRALREVVTCILGQVARNCRGQRDDQMDLQDKLKW